MEANDVLAIAKGLIYFVFAGMAAVAIAVAAHLPVRG
jgi:hypothetical protein